MTSILHWSCHDHLDKLTPMLYTTLVRSVRPQSNLEHFMTMVTVHCTGPKHPIVIKPIQPTIQTTPNHCPCCSNTRKPTKTDGWDLYAIQLSVSRKMTIHLLLNMPLALAKATNQKSLLKLASKDQIADMTFHQLPAHVIHGTSLINAVCKSCKSGFEFKVSSIDSPTNPTSNTTNRTIKFCPYCATPTLEITPITDPHKFSELLWDELAKKFNLPYLAIRAFYTYWESHCADKSFDDWYTNYLTPKLTEELTFHTTFYTHTPTSHKIRRLALDYKPRIHKIKLRATKTPTPPTPLHTLNITSEYNHCKICDCELPKFQFGATSRLKVYCEQCELVSIKERNLTIYFNSMQKGGC